MGIKKGGVVVVCQVGKQFNVGQKICAPGGMELTG